MEPGGELVGVGVDGSLNISSSCDVLFALFFFFTSPSFASNSWRQELVIKKLFIAVRLALDTSTCRQANRPAGRQVRRYASSVKRIFHNCGCGNSKCLSGEYGWIMMKLTTV